MARPCGRRDTGREREGALRSRRARGETASHLLRVHEAVVVEVLVVNGEAAHSPHLGVTGLVEALTHHQHWVVEHVGGALGHGVHANDVNDADDALRGEQSG